jgi:hypothetical protein
MGATQRATLAVLAATLGGLATRNSFVSEQREEHWLQCSPSRHTALSSRHAGPAWLKTAYEATGLNATTDAPPTSSWRNAPLAFLFADSETPAEATPTFLATARVLQFAALGATAAASAGLAYALPATAVDGSLLLLAALPPLYMFQDTLFGASNWALTVLLLAIVARGAVVMPSGLRGWLWSAVGIAGSFSGSLFLYASYEEGFGALIFIFLAMLAAAPVVAAVVAACTCAAIADAVVQAHECYVGASHVLAYSRSFESPSVTTVELSPSAKASALVGGAPCAVGLSAKCLVAGAA